LVEPSISFKDEYNVEKAIRIYMKVKYSVFLSIQLVATGT